MLCFKIKVRTKTYHYFLCGKYGYSNTKETDIKNSYSAMQEFTLCHVSNITVYLAHANKPLFLSDNLAWMRVVFLE